MISAELLNRFYPNDGGDGAVKFYGWIRQNIKPSTVLLNLGAGPPANRGKIRVLRGEVAKVVGADIDPEVMHNPDVDEAHVIGPDGRLPFSDSSFDMAISDWVLEHVKTPGQFLSEVCRVLKPGGSFFFRTPNKNHYVALIARCTPEWFHNLVANRARGYPPGEHEPWPTFYRLNSRKEIEREARSAGFKQIEIRIEEFRPGYLVFNSVPFLLGVGYERIVNRYQSLEAIRGSILAKVTK
ncbi:MAG TPA: methyltransferase domain-containing protein [Candidatus Binataceae bacterium]|nr:methyltransferase domain-containing protein [Candidatus Binataceae bacterium]